VCIIGEVMASGEEGAVAGGPAASPSRRCRLWYFSSEGRWLQSAPAGGSQVTRKRTRW
jgi:hypothetical protein